MPSAEYRKYLYPSNAPRLSSIRGLDAYEYREAAKADPFTGGLIRGWKPLQLADFRGVSEDGTPRPEVHAWEPARPGEEAPVADMVAAARDLLTALDEDARAKLCHPVDGVEWQTWANPEFLQFDTGVRLEFQPPEVRKKALALVEPAEPRGLPPGARHDADQRLPRRGRGPAEHPQ